MDLQELSRLVGDGTTSALTIYALMRVPKILWHLPAWIRDWVDTCRYVSDAKLIGSNYSPRGEDEPALHECQPVPPEAANDVLGSDPIIEQGRDLEASEGPRSDLKEGFEHDTLWVGWHAGDRRDRLPP
jgi:hypothetical protein